MADEVNDRLCRITERFPHIQIYLARLGFPITITSPWQVELEFDNRLQVFTGDTLEEALCRAQAHTLNERPTP